MEGNFTRKPPLMVMVGAFLVLVVVQADHEPAVADHKLRLPPNSSPFIATSAPDDPRNLPSNMDVDFNFKKFPKIPGAGVAKNALKKASCPKMCTFFYFGLGGIGWFSVCAAPCLITCFTNRPSDVTTNFVYDCTMLCNRS